MAVDARFMLRPTKLNEIALGIDNIFGVRYFVYHPYPGRTFHVEGRLRM
jgi:iron complex outermembrane recepter protein